MPFRLNPKLKNYATDDQWTKLLAWEHHNSARRAAEELGVTGGTITAALRAVKRKAARRGYAPEHDLTHPAADGMVTKGTSIRYDGAGNVEQYWNKTRMEGADPEEVVRLPDPKTIVKLSTLYDQEGNVTQQWVAEKPDAVAQAEAWKLYAEELAKDLPRLDPIPAPTLQVSELMTVYPVGDHHMGMLAWAKETGENYDLKIGEELMVGAANYLVDVSPPSQQGLVLFLGDFMHYDSFEPVTPTNRNQLDADGRYPKMVRASLRCMRYMIEKAAEKHKFVNVIVEIGNHDLSSSIFLMEALRNIYENNQRILIDTSPMHFHYFQFGQNLIGTHHGHGKAAKLDQLPQIMANDRARAWGETTYRYWFTGHVHHDQVKDFAGCRVESVRVLAAPDAYAAQNGWRSKRDMKAIIFHHEFGEVARHVINPDRLRAISP